MITRTDAAIVTGFALLVIFFIADTLVDMERRKSWSDDVTDELDELLAKRQEKEERRRGSS